MDSMAKSILQIRRGKNYTSRNFTRDVSLPWTRDLLPGGMREKERESCFHIEWNVFWVNSRLFVRGDKL